MPLTAEKYKEVEESGSSGIFDSLIETGLTKSATDDKMKSEKDFIALSSEGDVKKIKESDLVKKKVLSKKLDYLSLNVGFYILIPIIGGTVIGAVLDNYFKSKPQFIGIFLFLGVVAGFYNLFKLLKE